MSTMQHWVLATGPENPFSRSKETFSVADINSVQSFKHPSMSAGFFLARVFSQLDCVSPFLKQSRIGVHTIVIAERIVFVVLRFAVWCSPLFAWCGSRRHGNAHRPRWLCRRMFLDT